MRWDDTYNYTDQYGLIHTRRQFGGNGLLYLSECVTIACLNKTINNGIVEQFKRAVKFCEIERGLWKRSKENLDNQGPDDFIGVLTASGFVHKEFAWDFIRYGRDNAWNFNIPEPRKFSMKTWFGRFPALIAHAFHSVCVKPSLFQRLYWSFSLVLQSFKGMSDQSGHMLAWLMYQNYKHNGKSTLIQEAACAIYRTKINFQFKDLFKAYNGGEESEPLHPLRRYWDNHL